MDFQFLSSFFFFLRSLNLPFYQFSSPPFSCSSFHVLNCFFSRLSCSFVHSPYFHFSRFPFFFPLSFPFSPATFPLCLRFLTLWFSSPSFALSSFYSHLSNFPSFFHITARPEALLLLSQESGLQSTLHRYESATPELRDMAHLYATHKIRRDQTCQCCQACLECLERCSCGLKRNDPVNRREWNEEELLVQLTKTARDCH